MFSTVHVYSSLCAYPPWFSVVAVRRTVSKPPPPEQDCDWRQLLKCLDCFSSQCKSSYGSSLHVHTHVPSICVTVMIVVWGHWRTQCTLVACLGPVTYLAWEHSFHCSTSICTLRRALSPHLSLSLALRNAGHLVPELSSNRHLKCWTCSVGRLLWKLLKELTHGAATLYFNGTYKGNDANKRVMYYAFKIKCFLSHVSLQEIKWHRQCLPLFLIIPHADSVGVGLNGSVHIFVSGPVV